MSYDGSLEKLVNGVKEELVLIDPLNTFYNGDESNGAEIKRQHK